MLVYGGVSYIIIVVDNELILIGLVDNLFDKEYWVIGDFYGGGNMCIGELCMFVVKVKMDF